MVQTTASTNVSGLDVLLMAELRRLQRDQALLERLYQTLPSQPKSEEMFLSLWSDVEKRADRLEYMLDHMSKPGSIC